MVGTKNSGIKELIDRKLDGGDINDTTLINGVALAIKVIHMNEKIYKLQCWIVDLDKDLERFIKFYPSYLAGTHGAILLANLGDMNSLTALEEWISLIRQTCKIIPIMLIVNRPKVDQERQISEQDGIRFAQEHELGDYMEIDNHNGLTTNMFEKITRLILGQYKRYQ